MKSCNFSRKLAPPGEETIPLKFSQSFLNIMFIVTVNQNPQYFQLQTTLTVDPWANYLIISGPISFVANRNTCRIYFLSFHIEISKQVT